MLQYFAQATQPAEDPWGQLRNAVVGVLVLIVVAGGALVVKWLNSLSTRLTTVSDTATRGETKADSNSQRITNTAAHVAQVDSKQTDLAVQVGQATATAKALKQAAEPPTGTNQP